MATAAEVHRRLGRRVKILREGLGLTQVDLAESLGLDASTVRALEAGRRGCSLVVLVNLASKLGTAPGDLLDRAPKKQSDSARDLAAQVVAAMDEGDQRLALSLLRALRRHADRRR